MATINIREQLRNQIDQLPDDLIEQITDFTLSVIARRQAQPSYADWSQEQWQEFSLKHLFQDEDEVNYSLEDAQEIYIP